MIQRALFFLFILAAFIGCVKEDDDSDAPLTAGYTTISGQVLTSGNKPLKGVALQVTYIETHYLASYHSWLKKGATTEANGNYSMSFNIKDDEVESYSGQSSSYFELQIDFSNLDPDKYFLSYYSYTSSLYQTRPSLKQDTTYHVSFYMPAKDYITVHLSNFKPVQEGDRFEVQTFFPWGWELQPDENDGGNFLNSEYGISSSGYDNFVAKNENQTFRVPVARSDTNIVRIIKIKGGVASPEDHKIFVPNDNNIELTFDY
ncbi:MAG: hypothetical protein AB2L20_25705 [Mangrovibacterium sp.]